jgi:hypothetical protein
MSIFCTRSLAHLTVIDLITFITFDERYKLSSRLLLLFLIIALSILLFTDTLRLSRLEFNPRVQFSGLSHVEC